MKLTKGFVNNCRNIGALRDFLCQAIDQVDAMEEERRWRECSKELPEEGVDVLIYNEDIGTISLAYMEIMPDGQIWFWPTNCPHIDGVTYWMPLPKAPEN